MVILSVSFHKTLVIGKTAVKASLILRQSQCLLETYFTVLYGKMVSGITAVNQSNLYEHFFNEPFMFLSVQVLICQVTCYIAEDQLFQWTEKVGYIINQMNICSRF